MQKEFPEFLRMRNVDVARGQKVVLQDVNLTIAAGEHIAILVRMDAASRL